MGIRPGGEYRKSLRDGRTIYVNGERVKDVTIEAMEGKRWEAQQLHKTKREEST